MFHWTTPNNTRLVTSDTVSYRQRGHRKPAIEFTKVCAVRLLSDKSLSGKGRAAKSTQVPVSGLA